MPFCQNCGSVIQEGSRFCATCGASLLPNTQTVGSAWAASTRARPSSLSAGFVGGHVIAAIGSFMLVIGPFLAWATALWVSVSGLQKTGNEAVALVILGVIGLALSVVALVLKRRGFNVGTLVVGLVSLAMTVWYYVQLRDMLSEAEAEEYAVSLGSGIYLCLVGAILVIGGAIVAFLGRRS